MKRAAIALCTSLGMVLAFLTFAAPSQAISYPSDANLIDLSAPPYNVSPNNTAAANTAAIQQALNTYANDSLEYRFAFRTLVLPAGTILINNTLFPDGAAIALVGRGQQSTTLKLADNSPGFGSASTPKYVYRPGIEGAFTGDNAAFANYLRDLTIEVGAGNPGAVALRWAACNSGAVQNVTLRASGTSGLRGLTLESSTGPSLVQNLTVEGFGVGIWANGGLMNNTVFTGTTLKNQRTAAIQNVNKVIQFEGLTVTGAPKAYEATSVHASGQFIDTTVTGKGTGAAFSVPQGSYLYTRNVSGTGWSNLIKQGTTTRFVGKTAITEWAVGNIKRGNTSVAWSETGTVKSLNLPHPKAPVSPDRPLTDYRKVVGTGDITSELQAAIDSGKKVVYVPWGSYTISAPVIVRGAVERIDFMGSRITDTGSGKIQMGTVDGTFAVIQNVASNMTFEQNGPDAMVLKNLGGKDNARNTVSTGSNATGDIHVENMNILMEIDRPVNMFVRGSNREGGSASISGGARVWLFGDNIEAHDEKGSPYMTINGSTVEILAGVFDNLASLGRFNSTTSTPLYTATNSKLALVIPGVYRGGAVTGHLVSDTVNGTRVGNVTSADMMVGPASGEWKRAVLPFYVSP